MPDHQQHPIPVVRAVIADAERRVLVLRRPEGTAGSRGWCLPGGRVNFGETLIEALRRKVREETGFRCLTPKFLLWEDSLPRESEPMHCLNLYFECAVRGSLHRSSEETESAWIAKEDLPSYNIVFGNQLGLLAYWATVAPIQPRDP